MEGELRVLARWLQLPVEELTDAAEDELRSAFETISKRPAALVGKGSNEAQATEIAALLR